jgi:Zn-dependent metalloprotease
MAKNFMNIRFHAAEQSREELENVVSRPRPMRGVTRAGGGGPLRTDFDNDEAAARYYLSRVLNRDERPAMRGLTAPERPEMVPDMHLQETRESPLTKTRLVRFEQTKSSIPVFGSQVIVELNKKRQLVAVNGQLAAIGNINIIPSISPKEALDSIAELVGVPVDELEVTEQPTTTLYQDNEKAWHLAYFFKKIPAAPEEAAEDARASRGHGFGPSPRTKFLKINYLVDAHDRKVLFYYSATPALSICRGLDELDINQKFYGLLVEDAFELNDPLRKIKTYSLDFKDVGAPVPANAIRNAKADFMETNKAAVSAHVNAMKVYDFYKSVLMRDGVDDKGMELVSIINCAYSDEEQPPEWHNAVWWENRMWYGQAKDGNGNMRSFSRYLDIIAHELTHGVTQYTADLVYQGESGALDESFSDIFGVIINNWSKSDVGQWDWELGARFVDDALPLRDLSNPARTYNQGDPNKTPYPDHMNNYKQTKKDSGGVHTNSNIHNKAAYNVLSATDNAGQKVFPPAEVAVMYYLCLNRLNSLATFSDTLQALVDVANTLYAGDAKDARENKIQYILNAYQQVGIGLPPSE